MALYQWGSGGGGRRESVPGKTWICIRLRHVTEGGDVTAGLAGWTDWCDPGDSIEMSDVKIDAEAASNIFIDSAERKYFKV